MLNLPRVTGWGTDTIAETLMRKGAENRDRETERTRMIGNALLQQAKEGNLNEPGYSFLNEKFPELAGTAKQANETAKGENAAKLQNMKLQKTELGWKLFNQKIDAANKFGDETIYGDAGRELQKTAMAEAKQFADMMGIPFNMSAAMEATDIKKEQKKFNMALLQKNITGIQQGASPEQIASVEGMLSVFASKNKGEPAIPIMEKMIATAKGRLEKETAQKEKQAEEGRKQQAEIAKEDRAATAPTPDIKEFQFARKEGYKGSFQKWQSEKKADKETGKGEVTWTTATNNLSKRFGSQDALGNIIITKELQDKHKLSQKKLVDLKKQGMDPLEAINTAEDYANQVESKYQEYMIAAKELKGKERKTAEDKIKAAYKKKYGYLPR